MRKLLVLLVLGVTSNLQSQNLVANPSFESYTLCPDNASQINYAQFWQVTPNCGGASPDYYNSCSPIDMGVPTNVTGYQNAYNGNAYIGIYGYGSNSYQREYIQSQLLSPLVAGQTYYITFQASLAENFGVSIGSMGAHLSTTPVGCNGTTWVISNVVPQVISSALIISKTNWTQVSGTYVATGGEQYITIGNFLTDGSTPMAYSYPSAPIPYSSYYYIDMVTVSSSPLSTAQFATSEITMYPSPVETILHLDYPDKGKNDVIELYSSAGQLVYKTSGIITELDLNALSKGVYFISIFTQDTRKLRKKLVKI